MLSLLVLACGLFGGCSYINVFNGIITSKRIKLTQKELAISICTLFYDLGVILSGLIGLLLNKVIFSMKKFAS